MPCSNVHYITLLITSSMQCLLKSFLNKFFQLKVLTSSNILVILNFIQLFPLSQTFSLGPNQKSALTLLDLGQVLPSGDLALVLLITNLLSPENFINIGQSIQNLFMIFCSTVKQITPVPYLGMGRYFRAFFTFCSLCFRIKFMINKLI